MEGEHYVIIGNGPAGNRAADVLREGDADARVTIISDEFFLYYARHHLRHYLVGDKDEGNLVIREAGHYREHNIRLRLGQRMTHVDFASRTLFLAHKEKVHYTKLLLCTGAQPRIPEVHHAYAQHFTVMSTWTHARELRRRLPGVQRVVMAGGDLVSVRVCASLLDKGKEIYFIIDDDSFWPLEDTAACRRGLTEALGSKGARVMEDDAIARVEPTDAGTYTVFTRRGETILCDLVGAFFGLAPNVEFLYRSGLNIARGILVDEYLKTSQPDVYAAGDCAEVYHPELRNYWVSIGWPNALALGEIAARNILGETVRAGSPPVNAVQCGTVRAETSWWKDL